MNYSSVIDYAEKHIVNIPISAMPEIYDVLDPKTYIRFFESTGEKKSSKKGRDEKSNLYNELNESKDLIRWEQARSKNLLSLTLIYKEVKTTKYQGAVCPVRLNTLLTFEFYITISHYVNKCSYELEKIYNKMDDLEPLSKEYMDLQQESSELEKTRDILKEVNVAVVSSLQIEHLHILSAEYNEMSVEDHARKCLL